MKRPFLIRLETRCVPDTLTVQIRFNRSLDADQTKGFVEVMDLFHSLASIGALSGDLLDPTLVAIELEDRRLSGANGIWKFRDVQLDPSSLCVLLNMLHWGHVHIGPIRDVGISWKVIERLPDPLAVEFPRQWNSLSFDLELSDLLDVLDIDIEFVSPQPKSTVERINKTMGSWFMATNWGAYADDNFAPPESTIFFTDDVMDISEKRIIWYIDVFRCSMGALDGLVNLLQRVHRIEVPIRRVRFGAE